MSKSEKEKVRLGERIGSKHVCKKVCVRVWRVAGGGMQKEAKRCVKKKPCGVCAVE